MGRWVLYLHGSRMVASLCSLSHSVVVSMVSLCFCLQRVAFTASWFFRRWGIIYSVEFHLVETSCISVTLFCPSAVCSWCSSSVLAGLKWPTILQHFASVSLNPLSLRQTVMVLCEMWATHGICTNGSCPAAAIMVTGPCLFQLWWPFVELPRLLPQRETAPCSFQHSAW